MAHKKKSVLDPMATPYNKIPPQYPCLTYIIFPQKISSYNVVHFQQPKPLMIPPFCLPKPEPKQQKQNKYSSSLTSVPWGPRIPISRRHRRLKQQRQQWVPKNNSYKNEKGKKRWKNRNNIGYHKILPMETTTTALMIKNIPNKYTYVHSFIILSSFTTSAFNFIIIYTYTYVCIYLT